MSVRAQRPYPTSQSAPAAHAAQLQRDLQELRAVNAQVTQAAANANAMDAPELTMDDLNEVERSAASLGISPDAYKPIAFMNAAHFDTLLKKNVLSPQLAQRIEAYRQVALADEKMQM